MMVFRPIFFVPKIGNPRRAGVECGAAGWITCRTVLSVCDGERAQLGFADIALGIHLRLRPRELR